MAQVKRETKRKIRVDFERAPFWVRFKSKFLSLYFWKRALFLIFKLVLLVGVSYVILYPYITKFFNSFKVKEDFTNATVILFSKSPTLEQYKYIIVENHYFQMLLNTFLVSFSVALLQTLICALIAYGLAKFKFKGNNIIFILVVLTMMVPQQVIQTAMSTYFVSFGDKNIIGNILQFFGVMKRGFNHSLVPLYLLSITGLGFKNGLFIFMLRQFFRGVPDELEESAYVDGSSTFRTFFSIIIPISIPMLITVFIFAFAWQWTDDFYINMFLTDTSSDAFKMLVNTVGNIPASLAQTNNFVAKDAYHQAITGTSCVLLIIPLIIAYLFVQNKIVQGIERSGIVG